MATLHVPDDPYEQIRDRAEVSGRSPSAEVVVLLRGALEEKRASVGEMLNEIRRRRSFRPAEAGVPGSTALMREDRNR